MVSPMRKTVLKWSIHRLNEAERLLVQKRHDKKFANLMKEKADHEGTNENPNELIWNFSGENLTNEEEATLKYGLKHGVANRPNENDIMASAEAFWQQINSKGLCRDGPVFARQAKNQLRALAFNLINLDEKQFFKDKKKLETIRSLKERVVLLTPDKGNGVVILKKEDYEKSIEELFADRSKFKILNDDPTNTRLTTLQNFLRSLKKRGEIDEAELKAMYPENAKPGRAYGTAKVHKEFETIPPLRPIVDTIGSTHYGVGKYLTKLLNPLTQNEHVLKDSFEAARRIRNGVTEQMYEEGYVLVSFDVKSLFTNVPLSKTLDVILDRVYNQRLVTTKLKKRTLKKLILDTCTKTVFLANGKILEQIDGVSMGASMGPVLANIIMTELERVVVDPMLEDGTLKFYGRYVDDTLLLVKPERVDEVLAKFNAYHRSLQFTVDKFENEVPHFLDLELHRTGISIYRKPTHTGQFTHYESFTKWGHRVAWIRSLVNRARNLCDPSKLKQEIRTIKKFASWNGFPKWIANSVVKKAMEPQHRHQEREDALQDQEQGETIYLSLPYLGSQGETLVKRTTKKMRRLLKREKNVQIKVFLETTKMSFYTSNKDRTPYLNNSRVVYEYTCPGCADTYVGKTNNTLWNRTGQHAWTQKDSSIHKHFKKCEHWKELVGFMAIGGVEVDIKEHQILAVRENTKVIQRDRNYLKLDFLESLEIKHRNPELNKGLKACKELALF